MKRCLIFILIAVIAVLLCACNADTPPVASTSASVPSAVSSETPASSQPETSSAVNSEEHSSTETSSEATSSTVESEAFEPYVTRLMDTVQIFDGPGYDNVYVQTVGHNGAYTIVEELNDEDGNLWGRLKSGIGWVNLTDAAAMETAIITAGFTNFDLLHGREYHECIVDDGEYSVMLGFYPQAVLKDFCFYSMALTGDTLEVDEVYFTAEEVNDEIPFVATVVYYGDMTTYGISFKDENGNLHKYLAYISGRNGCLMFEQVTDNV